MPFTPPCDDAELHVLKECARVLFEEKDTIPLPTPWLHSQGTFSDFPPSSPFPATFLRTQSFNVVSGHIMATVPSAQALVLVYVLVLYLNTPDFKKIVHFLTC